jgi:riboflavin-specific deaminase-like protein
VDAHHKIFRSPGAPVLVLTTERISRPRLKNLKAAAHNVKIFGADEINFKKVLAWLQKEWNVKRLLCEGGGQLNDALFRAAVVDEVNLTVCPLILGGRKAPTLAEGWGFGQLKDAARFSLKSCRQLGNEMFLVYRKA